MIDTILSDQEIVQFVLSFLIIPLLFLFFFLLIARRLREKNNLDRDIGISYYSIMFIFILALIGFFTIDFGYGPLISITTALAQFLPITMGIFLYSEAKAEVEHNIREMEKNDFCERIEGIEAKLGIEPSDIPFRVRR